MSTRHRFTLALVGLVLAGALALLAHSMRPRPPLPVLGKLPDFHLVDQSGAPFGSEAMLGHVSVVDFIFTRCASSCPRLTARMGELQSKLQGRKSGARLVTFSVDPDNDTPAVLAEYASRAHADPSRWSFLTGPQRDIERTIVSGFKVADQKLSRDAGDYDVIHGDWFVVVDPRGLVRGYYEVGDPADFEALAADVQRLERGR